MAQYRVLTKSYINGSIQEEGSIVEYDGRAGSNLELIEESEKPAPQKGKGKKGAAASSHDDDAVFSDGE